LPDLRLMQLDSRPQAWHEWFEAQQWHCPQSYHGPRFETFHMLINAAKSGCGIALIPRFLIQDELRNGQLQVAWPFEYATPGSYYLAYPEHTGDLPKIQALIQWMSDQMGSDIRANGMPDGARSAPRAESLTDSTQDGQGHSDND